jgi:DNA-binding LytR/AlgR family response regulator
MKMRPSALIADDEPLLRTALASLLAELWPDLDVVAQARNGREALDYFERFHPEICFLDVHMPGLSGIDAARQIGRRAHLVFVTAFDQYAVQAFSQGVLDYLVKPVEAKRLAETISRLKERLHLAQPATNTEALLQQLASQLLQRASAPPAPLQWIRAQSGQTLRLIPVDAIDYFRSDTKYTVVAWRGDDGEPAEAVIRTALKELIAQLDPAHFVQIHRSYAVNLRSVSHVRRGEAETANIHFKGRCEVLPVSRSYLNLFRQM